MKRVPAKAKASFGVTSQTRKLIRQLERTQRSREHSALVTKMNREQAALVREGPRSKPRDAPIEEEEKEVEFEEEDSKLIDSLEEVDKSDSEESEELVQEEESEPKPVEETIAESDRAYAPRKRKKPTVPTVAPAQHPRLKQSAIDRLIAEQSGWSRCSYCKNLLRNESACKNQAFPNQLLHLHCIQVAYILRNDV